jgi:hypothetical protein
MAITTTDYTTLDYLKRELGKIGASAVNFLSDAAFNKIIVGCRASSAQTFSFTRDVGDGSTGTFYTCPIEAQSLYTFGSSFYTETGGVSSTFSAGWKGEYPTILVTAGTQSGTTIEVTATPIDVRRLMMKVLSMLETHARLDSDSYNIGGFGVSKNGLAENIATMKRDYQGPFGV